MAENNIERTQIEKAVDADAVLEELDEEIDEEAVEPYTIYIDVSNISLIGTIAELTNCSEEQVLEKIIKNGLDSFKTDFKELITNHF